MNKIKTLIIAGGLVLFGAACNEDGESIIDQREAIEYEVESAQEESNYRTTYNNASLAWETLAPYEQGGVCLELETYGDLSFIIEVENGAQQDLNDQALLDFIRTVC